MIIRFVEKIISYLLIGSPTIRMNKYDWKELVENEVSTNLFKEECELLFGTNINEIGVLHVTYIGTVGIHLDYCVGFLNKKCGDLRTSCGLGYYTSTPKLNNKTHIFYSGGITWAIDMNGERYHKIVKETGLPVDWELVRAKEHIYRYLDNNNKLVKLKQ